MADQFLEILKSFSPSNDLPTVEFSGLPPWTPYFLSQLVEEFLTLSPTQQQELLRKSWHPQHQIASLLWAIYKYRNYREQMPFGNDLLRLYAISEDGYKFHIVSKLTPDPDQHVYGAILENDPIKWVIKWTNDDPIDRETEISAILADLGGETPIFFEDVSFWGSPVLVMEQLQPLDASDSPFEVGIQILKTLQLLWGVHCDIKPGNIMKRVVDRFGVPLPKPQYLLIDYGGFTDKIKHYGFERYVWSKSWSSQMIEPGQITTKKNDLLELGYTMRGLELRIQNPNLIFTGNDVQREFFSGTKLFEYMEAVRQLDERLEPDYALLIEILKK